MKGFFNSRLARIFQFSRKQGMNYERGLYSVLLLIALFLVLVNFSSIRVVSRLRGVFEDQIYTDLIRVANQAVSLLSDEPKVKSSTSAFAEFIRNSYADSVEVIEINSRSVPFIPSLAGRLSVNQLRAVDNNEPLSLSPDSRSLSPGYVVLFPFETSNNRNFIMRLYKRADRFGVIDNVARFNVFFHISGLLAAILLGYLYVRVTLKPYQKMKKAAESATHEQGNSEVNMEHIVSTFQQMIDELKEKEKILQGLYRKTQKRAERLEQFNEYILAGMASGLISCDREGVITHFNRSAQKLLGIDESHALGNYYKEILSKITDLQVLVSRTLEQEVNSSRCELDIEKENGTTISLGVSTTLIRDELDRKVGATVIMTDLTEVKRLQKDIAYKENMAALGEMAAGLAHELRNSMTAVVGYGRLMSKLAHDNPQMLQVAESILREGSATEDMLERFLEFTQPTSFLLGRVDTVSTIDELIDGFRNIAEEKHVELEFAHPPDADSVWGDQLAVRQIVSNLLKNAIDASPPGCPVKVNLKTPKGNAFAELSISDQGPGIPENLRHKVFIPFYTTKENGTGLGLCTVRKLVAGMNGWIDLSPPDHDGLTITVRLPNVAGMQVGESSTMGRIASMSKVLCS